MRYTRGHHYHHHQSYIEDDDPARGSVNEKVALRRFSEFISQFGPEADLPVYIDEPGIWLCRDKPYLAGSPDNLCFIEVSHEKHRSTRRSHLRNFGNMPMANDRIGHWHETELHRRETFSVVVRSLKLSPVHLLLFSLTRGGEALANPLQIETS